MIKVTFPDGAVREFSRGTTGTTVVEGISSSLAKKTVAMKWNGVLGDLSDPLEADGKIEFVMRDSADGLGLIRHDAAHERRRHDDPVHRRGSWRRVSGLQSLQELLVRFEAGPEVAGSVALKTFNQQWSNIEP